MSASSSFVSLVGRAPFIGKGPVRRAYYDAVRGARDGDVARVEAGQREIRDILGTNTLYGGLGAFVVGVEARELAAWPSNSVLEATTTAGIVLAAIFSVGHAASAVAQQIMSNRLRDVVERAMQHTEEPRPTELAGADADPVPTILQRTVQLAGNWALFGSFMAGVAQGIYASRH